MHYDTPTDPATIQNSVKIRDRPASPSYDQFRPIRVDPVVGGYDVRIQPGYVEEVLPTSGLNCLVMHPVLYAGAAHTADTVITIPDGSTLVCKINQDETGAVKTIDPNKPMLVVEAVVTDSAHWYPDDPAGAGAAGTLYVPLFKIDKVSGIAQLTTYHWGPVDVRSDLWEGENVGTPEAGTGGGGEVLKDHAETLGAYYRFRKLSEGPSGRREITVTEVGDLIKIMGNAFDKSGSGAISGLVVVDGLVTGFTDGGAAGWTHPWKVTGSDADAVVTAGFVFGIKAQGTNTSPWVWLPFEFAGETKAITVDGYLYAEVNTTTETLNDETPAGSGILSQVARASGVSASVVWSASAPSAYTGSVGYCYVPIAKVSLVGGDVVVDKQYLTHNPYVAIPDIYQD